MFVDSRLLGSRSQRKTWRQRISESGRVRKETAIIDIFRTWWNGDRKIMQPIIITSTLPWEIRKNKEFG